MTIDVPTDPAARPAAAFTTAAQSPDFDQRWPTRQAKVAAEDRAVRRTMADIAPMLGIIAAVVVIYAMFWR